MSAGKPIEVNVKRTSGEMEKDWIVTKIVGEEAVVLKPEGKGMLRKVVPVEELKEWNK